MKRKLLILSVTLTTLAMASVAFLALARTSPEGVPEGARTVTLDVQGMQSLMCEMGVKSTLKQIEGVEAVTVDRPNAAVEVSFDPELADPASFVQAVNAVGFRASLPDSYAKKVPAPSPTPAAHVSATSTLDPEQVERVADFIAAHILATEEIPDGETIEAGTGVKLSIGDTPILQQAVLAKLADDPRGQELLAGSRCSDYGACSMWGNLSGASGDILALYEREKALDGTTYDDRELPEFEARNLAGETVRSADLVGKPAVLALLSVHCNHSMETFPILQELHRQYSEEGLQVVGVLVNSGTVEDANGWIPHFAPEHPIWVVEGDDLGDLVGSHLVPTYLLVDERGKVRELLVGYQEQASTERHIAELGLITPKAT